MSLIYAVKEKALSSPRSRLFFFALLSLFLNLIYAAYNGILGICGSSDFFITLCIYYTTLGVLRFIAVLSESKNLKSEQCITLFTGIMLIFLSLVITYMIYITMSKNMAVKYGTIIMITIATYTFYKITMAVIRFIRLRKIRSPIVAAVSHIGYADISVSIFTMQCSMLVTFNGMSEKDICIMNAFTGGSVFLFVLLLGISLIKISLNRRNKNG